MQFSPFFWCNRMAAAYYEDAGITIHRGDCREILRTLPDESLNCCVTSPPYWGLRDYGIENQLGLEATPEEYVAHLVEVFREVRRVLRDDGTLWLNLGDSYAAGGNNAGSRPEDLTDKQRSNRGCRYERRIAPSGLKPKDLVGIPWRVAFALQADGWYLRSDIIWHKPNPMPEAVTDRPTKAHEYIFLLSKSEKYYYDAEAIKEPAESRSLSKWQDRKADGEPTRRGDPSTSGHITRTATLASSDGRNKRSVWTVPTEPYPEAHFATFPEDLIKPCIKAGSPSGGTVLDPFGGSGTTAQVARALGCHAVLIELNEAYCSLAENRLSQRVLDFLSNRCQS